MAGLFFHILFLLLLLLIITPPFQRRGPRWWHLFHLHTLILQLYWLMLLLIFLLLQLFLFLLLFLFMLVLCSCCSGSSCCCGTSCWGRGVATFCSLLKISFQSSSNASTVTVVGQVCGAVFLAGPTLYICPVTPQDQQWGRRPPPPMMRIIWP